MPAENFTEVSFYSMIQKSCNSHNFTLLDKNNDTTTVQFDENGFAKLTLKNETYRIIEQDIECNGTQVVFDMAEITPLKMVRKFLQSISYE